MIGSTIILLDSVDSTNNYAAKELLTKSLNEGTVFAASCQHAGRGQGSASWESAAGVNLTISIVLYPKKVEVARQFSISKAVALGITDFLSEETESISIKWPNDIYAGDGKIAGILIEVAISAGQISRAIVGIGLNINQEKFVSDAPNPVSLKNLTGKDYDLTEMLGRMCARIDMRYNQLIRGGKDTIDQEYEMMLYRRGVWAKYGAEGVNFEGMITGIDDEGRLMMRLRNGEIRTYRFKEIQFL